MSTVKKLAGQTLIYGLGTIAPRMLNYLLLTPFYTEIFQKAEYGVVTELYAYVAFLMVILTYGMETTYFRFVEKEPDKSRVYSTSALSLLFSSLFFVILVVSFNSSIAGWLHYAANPEYFMMLGLILAMDAFASIPFARLRNENRPMRFSLIKMVNVLVNILLNLLFFVFYPRMEAAGSESFLMTFYNPSIGVGYAFIANLIASLVTLLMLIPQIAKIRFEFDFSLLKKMLAYAWPLVIIGIAGMINEVSDKFVFKFIMVAPEGTEDANEHIMSLLGVYGANTKLAVLMTLFIQMFKFAAEPFFFQNASRKEAKKIYADVMKYFVIFGLLIFLTVMLYLDVVKYFINERFHEGLFVVPIILMGNLFLGIFYNLSVWYKLNDLTRYGALIAVIGASLTLLINILFVPLFSYTASAWGHFVCYLSMMMISFFWGRKYFPVPYPLKRIFLYFTLALSIYLVHTLLPDFDASLFNYLISTVLLGLFLIVVIFLERKEIRSAIA